MLALGCRSPEPAAEAEPAAAEAEAATAEAPAEPDDGGEVVAISGPGGVGSPSLPSGTFLGKGGRLQVGQSLKTPKGTLAELRLPGGIRVRMNEDTALVLPGAEATASRLVLTQGEVVVLTEPGSTAQLQVAAGDEVLTVARGEAQIRHAGAVRRYAVVNGTAELAAPSRNLTLGAGESIEAPLPEERSSTPELSLAPLQETDWSRTFETASRMADEVTDGVGSLTARRPGSQQERQRLQLTDQKVTVNIAGRIAHTEVEQAFFNDRPAVLEGIYRFPMPGDGSVSGLSLLVGNRWMEGEIVEKTRGRAIFKQIVDATIPRDPALLEWERGNQFKLRVFPIPGRGERKVRLSYTQVLPVAGRTLRYRFPMAGSGAGGTEIGHFEFAVTVDGQQSGKAQLADIETPMMELDRSFEDGQVRLSTARDHFVPTADIGIDIPLGAEEARVHSATHLDRDGQAYFMVSMRPDLELPRPEGPTSFAFVLDRSHSTSPELWTAARGMVEALAGSMEPEDRFVVLACDTACDQAPGGMLSPGAGDLDETRRFLERQDLAGASDLGGMLITAAEALERGSAPGDRVIVYLGDGMPSSGEMAADQLARHVKEPLRDTRVMAVALGARSDLTTLGAIVKQTGGDILRADPRDDRHQLVRELRLRARVPMATDLTIDTPDGMVAVHRHGTAGLRPGDNLVLVGKLSRPVHDDVIVRTAGPSGPVETRFRVDLEADRGSPQEHRHLPRTWAQAEIADLTQTRGFDARDEIIALSKHYTVMSRHTSLIVLENDQMYREFNVVRAAKNTDKWDGNLPKAEAATEARDEAKEAERASAASSSDRLQAELRGEDDASARELDELRPIEEAEPSAIPEDTRTTRPSSGSSSGFGKGSGGVAGGVPGGVPGGVAGGTLGGVEEKAKGDSKDFDRGPTPEPDPFPAAQPTAAEDEESELDDVDFGDDDGEFASDGAASSGNKRGGGGKAPSTKSTSKPRPKKTKKKKPASSSPWLDDPFEGGGGGGGWSPPPGGRWGWSPPVRQLRSRPVTTPDSRALARVDSLQLAVDADPTQRSAHGKLVRAALRAGHARSLEFAQAWAEVDPDHAPALMSLADAMAADGDPMALRAYESALEVKPFLSRHHTELAQAYASKGDLRRSCSHRRAVVSIDPQDGDNHVALARCLAREGRDRDALDALDDAGRRAIRNTRGLGTARAEVGARAVPLPRFDLHRAPQLRATLTWAGGDELDLAVVDAKGRRLSALRPQGKARVREATGHEELTLKKVSKSVFIEVTRPTPTRAVEGERGTIRGELVLKTPGGTRRIPVSVREGTVRVAKVFWTTR